MLGTWSLIKPELDMFKAWRKALNDVLNPYFLAEFLVAAYG
jgi:hypothetical protein